MQVRTAERVREKVLDDLVVAPPDRYAGITPDRYAGITRDRYAGVTVSRYAVADRYSSAAPAPGAGTGERYRGARYAAATGRRYQQGTGPKRQFVRRVVLVGGTWQQRGELLWLPCMEFERCFEYNWPQDGVWILGTLFNFSEAADSLMFQGAVYNPLDAYLEAQVIPDEAYTFTDEEWFPQDSEEWPHAMDLARQLRAGFAEDPERFTDDLVLKDLEMIAEWAGLSVTPLTEAILAAIAVAPAEGLGGAALDYAVWHMATNCGGDLGDKLEEAIDTIEQEEAVRRAPTENMLLSSGSLHPDTARLENEYNGHTYYQLYGTYVLDKATYHSDPTGKVVAGWRSLFLLPYGEPQRPCFE